MKEQLSVRLPQAVLVARESVGARMMNAVTRAWMIMNSGSTPFSFPKLLQNDAE